MKKVLGKTGKEWASDIVIAAITGAAAGAIIVGAIYPAVNRVEKAVTPV